MAKLLFSTSAYDKLCVHRGFFLSERTHDYLNQENLGYIILSYEVLQRKKNLYSQSFAILAQIFHSAFK